MLFFGLPFIDNFKRSKRLSGIKHFTIREGRGLDFSMAQRISLAVTKRMSWKIGKVSKDMIYLVMTIKSSVINVSGKNSAPKNPYFWNSWRSYLQLTGKIIVLNVKPGSNTMMEGGMHIWNDEIASGQSKSRLKSLFNPTSNYPIIRT